MQAKNPTAYKCYFRKTEQVSPSIILDLISDSGDISLGRLQEWAKIITKFWD